MKESFPFEPDSRSMTFPVRIFWCIAFFGPAIYFGYQGDYLVAALLAFGGIGAFSGFRVGILTMVTTFAAIAAAIVYAPQYGMQYEYKVSEFLGTTGLMNRCISVLSVGILISMAVWMISSLTIGRFVRSRPGLSRMNRLTGFTLGYAQGVAGIAVLVGGLLVFEPLLRRNLADANVPTDEHTLVHRAVFGVVDHTDSSVLGPYLRDYNPMEKIPQLNRVQEVHQTAAVLSDPSKINQMMSHPSMIKLQGSPSVQRVVEELRSDESINQILTSGKPMDRSAAMTLLNHPAVLDLVDQPGFLDQASKAIEEAGL